MISLGVRYIVEVVSLLLLIRFIRKTTGVMSHIQMK